MHNFSYKEPVLLPTCLFLKQQQQKNKHSVHKYWDTSCDYWMRSWQTWVKQKRWRIASLKEVWTAWYLMKSCLGEQITGKRCYSAYWELLHMSWRSLCSFSSGIISLRRKKKFLVPKLGLAFIALSATVCFVSACKPWGMLLLPQKAAVVLLAASWVPKVQSLRYSHRGESSLCAWSYLLDETGPMPKGPVKEGTYSSAWMLPMSANVSHGDLRFGMSSLEGPVSWWWDARWP